MPNREWTVGWGAVVLVVFVGAYWVAFVVADFEVRVDAADAVAFELVAFAAAAAVVVDDAVAIAFVALVGWAECFEMMVVFVEDALAVEDVEEPAQ